jgi:hypothetical protein
MSEHATESAAERLASDNIRIDVEATRLSNIAYGVGAAGLIGAVGLGMSNLFGFFQAYVTAFMFTLAIALGVLWFVCIQHLTNARWSVVVRRVAEIMTAGIIPVALLALGIVVPMALGGEDISKLYLWLDDHQVHANHLLHHKAGYLNKGFFVVRCVIYFGVWAALSHFFFKASVAQDESGKPELTRRMQGMSAPAMILFALTLTFCAFDFLMSLDPTWFSTIYGVYYFAGCVLSGYSMLALGLMWLQSKGRLKSVTTEHFHDLGKIMFGFTVFWSYIAFSQFMLIWYGDVPEETHWYHARFTGGWKVVSAALLVCHFVIPFLGLMSRHVKRNKKALAFWAVWMLVVEYLDLFWLVHPDGSPEVPFTAMHVLAVVGMLGVFVGFVARKARGHNLVPTKDPKLGDSLAFENI